MHRKESNSSSVNPSTREWIRKKISYAKNGRANGIGWMYKKNGFYTFVTYVSKYIWIMIYYIKAQSKEYTRTAHTLWNVRFFLNNFHFIHSNSLIFFPHPRHMTLVSYQQSSTINHLPSTRLTTTFDNYFISSSTP